MWVTISLAIANLFLSVLGRFAIRIPGLELTAFGMVVIAQSGENIWLGAILLSLGYMVPQPRRFALIWLHAPVAVFAGYVLLWTGNPYLPILVFHAISLGMVLILGMITMRAWLYHVFNLILSLAAVRFYTMMT